MDPQATAEPPAGPLAARAQAGARALALLALLWCVLVLLGWVFDIAALKSVHPGLIAMKANAAIAFLLLGLSALLLHLGAAPARRETAGTLLALGGAAIGALTLAEYLLGWDAGIDQLLFTDPPWGVGVVYPGRPPFNGALNMLLLGAALLLLWRGGAGRVAAAQGLALAAALIALLALSGYVYGVQQFTGLAIHNRLPLNGALISLMIAISVLGARPQQGLMTLAISESPGGRMLRRLLPWAVVVPLAVGWLRLEGERAGLYGTEFGVGIMALAIMLTFSVLLFRHAVAMQAAEVERLRLHRALQTISAANRALVHTDSEQALYEAICRIAIDVGGFRMAWVGLAQYDEARTVKPAAWAGANGDYVSEIGIVWADTPQGRGPTGTAIRSAQPVINRDFEHNAAAAPWRERALAHGYRSSLALPLLDSAGAFGALMIYAAEPDAFGAREVEVFEELARDLSFGVATLRIRAEHARTQDQVRRANRYHRALLEAIPDALVSFDASGRITDVNAAAEQLHGYPRAEIVGKEVGVYVVDPDRAREGFAKVLREGVVRNWALQLRHRDGHTIPVLCDGAVYHDASGATGGVVVAVRDVTEIQRAEESLRQSEERLRLAVTSMPLAYIVFGTDFRVVTWNPAAERMFGYTATETHGKLAYELIVPAHVHPQTDVVWSRLMAGEPVPYVNENVTKDGRTILCEWSNTPLRQADGTVIGVLSMAQDITERQRAEDALRQSEARFRTLTLAAAPIVWIASADGRITTDLPEWRAYTGQTREAVQGYGWTEALHPDDRERTLGAWNAAVATRGLYETEYRIRRYDGEYRWFAARGAPVLGADGSIREWIGTSSDIHARKQAEAQVRELAETLELRVEERTQALRQVQAELRARMAEIEAYYNTAPVGLCFLDKDLRYVRINARLAEINGVQAEQHIGRTIREVLPTLADQAEAVARRVAETRTPMLDIEFSGETLARPGEPRVWLEHWYPQSDADGALLGFNVAVVDVTQQRRAADEIAALNRSLEQGAAALEAANQDLEAFVYSVSHDLRAPLRAIDSFTEILVEEYGGRLDAEGRRLIGVLRTNAERMGHLIDGILAFSRAGRHELQMRELDMAALCRTVYEELKAAAGARRIEFTVAALPPAWADEAAMRQVLSNLLSNAIKFTAGRSPAQIEVSGEAGATETIYTVRDNGAGFDPQYAAKLFGVFQRLHGAEYEGSGIGLAIVKRFVEKHGGRVWAEGAPDQGASFHFALPRQGAADVRRESA